MEDFLRAAKKTVHVKTFDKAEKTLRSFSHSGRALFYFFSGLLVLSSAALIYTLNESILVSVPAHGGSLTEGIIGAPRFINPVLAISDADRDLTALTYSGLLRATPEGNFIADLAESYTVSPDGLIYTAILRSGAVFSDNTKITADDVIFTIQKTQDPSLKSPVRANWDGVLVSKIDERTVRFTLKAPYAPFVENLTLGILPKHLWQDVSDDEFPFSDLNVSPVGSGPFFVDSISRSSGGVPTSYDLKSFSRYVGSAPYLNALTFNFFQNENDLVSALRSGAIDSASGISPELLNELKGFRIAQSPLGRVFAVFFNQNQSAVLRDINVRSALAGAIDQNDLVKQVLGGYGTPLVGPVPSAALIENPAQAAASSTLTAAAKQKLLSKGWAPGPGGVLQKTTGKGKTLQTTRLAFTLATGNVPELRAAAEYLRKKWAETGAQVTVQIYEQGDLSQNIIRPRKYDALLFGEIIWREIDLFAFWHSSQRNDPGLNIALYANSAADKLLEQMRQSNGNENDALYQKFEAELAKDIPAVFLYAPDFVYTVPKDLQGLNLGLIETPSDRFLSVAKWHRESDQVWPFFAQKSN